jgi:hypothetical protein
MRPSIDIAHWRSDFFRHLHTHLKPEIANEALEGVRFRDYRIRVEQTHPAGVTVVVSDDPNSENEVYAIDEMADTDPFRLAWLTASWLKAKP